jgi:apolipoprotein N-acyltransferase
VIGTAGLSGLARLPGGALAMAILTARRARREGRTGKVVLLIGIPAAIMIALAPAIVFDRFYRRPPAPNAPVLRVVQPNIGQDVKWDEGHVQTNFAKLEALSGLPGPRPRLVIWPEAAIPFFLEENEGARTAIAALLGPRDLILTGAEAVQYGRDGEIISATNSVFGLGASARLLGRYDKAHLVPYGEYLPMRPLLSRIGLSRLAPGDIDFLPGPGARNLVLPGIGPVGLQICYEIIFSGRVVDRAHRPVVLINPSNDAWFGRWGPPQHLAQARLRAIEEAVPIVRSTPTGISAVIDRDGRLLAALPWRQAGSIEIPLPAVGMPTLFARIGNALPLIFAALLLIAGLASRRWAR